MSEHRLHTERIRFNVRGTEWEVLKRKSAEMKSGEMAPKMRISPHQRSEVEGVTSDQGVKSND